MTKEEKSKIKYRMKRLARKFCIRNHVYESFDGSVGELIKKGYLSAYFLCLHENKNKTTELKKENEELKEQNANLIAMLKSEREVRVNDDYLKGICELEGKVEDWTSEYYELENFMNNKLAKAKEILAKLLEEEKNNMYWEMNGSDKSSYYKIKKEAEQFLSEAKE